MNMPTLASASTAVERHMINGIQLSHACPPITSTVATQVLCELHQHPPKNPTTGTGVTIVEADTVHNDATLLHGVPIATNVVL